MLLSESSFDAKFSVVVFNGKIFWVVDHSVNLSDTLRPKNSSGVPVTNYLFWKNALFKKVALAKEYR